MIKIEYKNSNICLRNNMRRQRGSRLEWNANSVGTC